ncbi:hypothetical protein ACXN5S_05800 [Pseudoroseicyclus sp. H15]
MITVIDNSILTLLLNPMAKARPNPETGEPAEHIQDRLSGLLDSMSKRSEQLIVPAPALAESMCNVNNPTSLIETLRASACIVVAPFDTKASVEFSDLIRSSRGAIREIKSETAASWQFVKMDLQIVAIGKASGASKILTDDDRQGRFAKLAGIEAVHSWEIPLQDKYLHGDLFDPLR